MLWKALCFKPSLLMNSYPSSSVTTILFLFLSSLLGLSSTEAIQGFCNTDLILFNRYSGDFFLSWRRFLSDSLCSSFLIAISLVCSSESLRFLHFPIDVWLKSAPSITAFSKLALSKIADLKLTWLRFAPPKLAWDKFAPVKSEPARFAPMKQQNFAETALKLEFEKLLNSNLAL